MVILGFLRSEMKALSITLRILPLLMYSERAVCRLKKFLGCTAVEMLSVCFSFFADS